MIRAYASVVVDKTGRGASELGAHAGAWAPEKWNQSIWAPKVLMRVGYIDAAWG